MKRLIRIKDKIPSFEFGIMHVVDNFDEQFQRAVVMEALLQWFMQFYVKS